MCTTIHSGRVCPAARSSPRNYGRTDSEIVSEAARVEAELLEEKTRKGGWKAKHSDSGLEGPIQDSHNVPADAEPGQRIELTVASVSVREMAFKWAEPPSPKKKPNRRAMRTPQRGRR